MPTTSPTTITQSASVSTNSVTTTTGGPTVSVVSTSINGHTTGPAQATPGSAITGSSNTSPAAISSNTPAVNPSNTATALSSNTPAVNPSNTPPVTVNPSNTPSVTVNPSNTPPVTVNPSNTPPVTVNPSNTPPVTVNPSNTPPVTVNPSNTPPVTVNPSNTPSALSSKPPATISSNAAPVAITTRPAVSPIHAVITTLTNNNGGGNVNPGVPKVCPTPPTVGNGHLTSSPPYVAGTSAVYACSAGFTMVGKAMIQCGANLQWTVGLPQCLADQSNTDEQNGNNYYIGNAVPVWLAIILGMTFGVICLLMLICLVMYCLRMFGCWKGSVLGESPTNAVGPNHTTNASYMGQEVSKDHKGTTISYVDLEPFAGYSTSIARGQPPDDKQYYFSTHERRDGRGYRSRNLFAEPKYMDPASNARPEPRVKAKRPAHKWMPHAREKRTINTSTN